MTTDDGAAGAHFTLDDAGVPTAEAWCISVADVPAVELRPGLEFRPIVGEGMSVNFVTFAPNTVAPLHAHAEEQITVVLEGEFESTVAGVTRTMRAGDVALIPPWVPHGGRTRGSTCRKLDISNPPRASLLAHALTRGGARA